MPDVAPAKRLEKDVVFSMKRPYTAPGIGWILAVVALVVALLGLVGVAVPFLSTLYVLIILIALAILL
jgi:hypothetical protein